MEEKPPTGVHPGQDLPRPRPKPQLTENRGPAGRTASCRRAGPLGLWASPNPQAPAHSCAHRLEGKPGLVAASQKRPTHADRPTAGLPGRSLPRPAFLDPALGLPAPPFPVPGLEAHSYSSQSANGRHPEPSVGTRRRQRAWPGPGVHLQGGVHLRGLSTRSYSSLGAPWGSLKVSRARVAAVTRASSTHTPACVPGTLCYLGTWAGQCTHFLHTHSHRAHPRGQVCPTAPLASTLRLGGPRGAPWPLRVTAVPCGKEGDPHPVGVLGAGEGTSWIGRQEPSFPVFARGPHLQREGQCLSSLGTARRAPAAPGSRPRHWAEALAAITVPSTWHPGPWWGSQAKASSAERLRLATEELLTSPVPTAGRMSPASPRLADTSATRCSLSRTPPRALPATQGAGLPLAGVASHGGNLCGWKRQRRDPELSTRRTRCKHQVRGW